MSHPSQPPGGDEPSAGDLDPDLDPEVAELSRLLARSDDPVAGLLRPLSDEATNRVVQRALDAAQARKLELEGKKAEEDKGEKATVLLFPRRRPLPRLAMLAAAMVAVAAVVFFLIGGPEAPQRTAYHLEIAGDAVQRGDGPEAEGPVKLRPSTRLKVRLAPSVPVRDKALRVLVVRDGKATLIEGTAFAVAGDGAIVIDAEARTALGDQPDGPAELVFVVGRQVPSDDDVKRMAADRSRHPDADYDVLRRAVTFEGWGTTRRAVPAEEFGFAGCDAVTAGPVCEVAPGAKLRVWAPLQGAKGEEMALRVDDRPIASLRESVEEGTRLAIEIPAGAREIAVTDGAGEVVFRLPLRAAPSSAALQEARDLMGKNQLDAAETKLDEAERAQGPEIARAARRVRARLARRRGDGERMVALLGQAIADEHAAGRISDEAEDRQLRAYQHIVREVDFAAAREDLFGTFALEERCPECRVDGDLYRGMLAGETGRLHEALRWLRKSTQGARRLSLAAQEGSARNQMLDILAILGRHHEAQRLVDDSLREAGASADPCLRVRLVTSAAWALSRGAEAPESLARAESMAAEAVAVSRAQCPAILAGALVNLSFAELSARKIQAARGHLDEARRAASPGDLRLKSWSEALAIELDLAERPANALAAFDSLRQRGADALSPELLFRAASGRARALDTLQRPEARQAFAAAEAALDRWSALVPLGEGRQGFFVEQARWARLDVDFHVRLAEATPVGTPARDEAIRAAASIARKSLAAFFDVTAGTELSPMEDQSAYLRHRAAADEAVAAKKPLPRAPEAALHQGQARARAQGSTSTSTARSEAASESGGDSLTLTYHPVRDGWVGFAVGSDGRATMARLGAVEMLDALDVDRVASAGARTTPPDRALARILLAPFAEQIGRARALRVPAHGPLRHVPFEALSWTDGDAVLEDAVTVTYGFDAPVIAIAAPACVGPPRALLVTNPRGDLAGAESGGPTVQKALADRGWAVTWLSGHAARREAVLAALADPCTALFHYDGHARFEGMDGLRAALDLDDARLTVADVLALPHVPRAAVLLGCATARDDGMGLSQAFLARGAREVLASTDDVDDALSLRIAERLYDGAPPASNGVPALGPALRAAVAPARHGGLPWWLFRVIARA